MLQNDQYGFPYVLVCMWPEFGCSDEDVTACIDSAVTESTKVEYNGTIYSGTKSEVRGIDFRGQHARQSKGGTYLRTCATNNVGVEVFYSDDAVRFELFDEN